MGHQAALLDGHRRLRAQPRAKPYGSERGMSGPGPKDVKAIADTAGVPVDADVAARIANSVGPAFEGFAPVAGTLPFDLEPASFLLAQAVKVSR
jgi:hypothetical protein